MCIILNKQYYNKCIPYTRGDDDAHNINIIHVIQIFSYTRRTNKKKTPETEKIISKRESRAHGGRYSSTAENMHSIINSKNLCVCVYL